MKVVLLLAADYANTSAEGKLNVMGVFRQVIADIYPARHPSMYLVVKLEAELGEFGKSRELAIIMHDPEGNELLRVSKSITVPEMSGVGLPEVNLIVSLNDVMFPKPGPYQFVVMVEKDHKGQLPIYVQSRAPSASGKNDNS